MQSLQAELDKVQQIELAQSVAMANQKFWQKISKATGASVENLQLGINLLRSVLQELFGLHLFAQFSTYKRLQALESSGVYFNKTEKMINQVSEKALIENQALLIQIEQLKSELAKKD